MTNNSEDIFGHPRGLYICFLTEMWERFSFYGMKFLLLLYLTKYHLFSDDMGLDVLGSYAGLVYALPVIGGIIADRYLGMRKAVIYGAVMLCLGHLGMAFEGHQAAIIDGETVRDEFAIKVFYMSMAFIVVGVCFLKPNISTIVGKLYSDGDSRRDSGFTIFHMGINLGSFLATLLCGYLGEAYGWGYGFGAAGIGMMLGLVFFIKGQKYLEGHAEPHDMGFLKSNSIFNINKETMIYILSSLSVLGIWVLLQYTEAVHHTLNAMAVLSLAGIVWFVTTQCNEVERERMIVITILTIFTVVFWSFYEQSSASMILYADRVMDRVVLDHFFEASSSIWLYLLGVVLIVLPFFVGRWLFHKAKSFNDGEKVFSAVVYFSLSILLLYLGFNIEIFAHQLSNSALGLPVLWEMRAAQTPVFNSFFVFTLAPLMAWLWVFLSKRNMEPSTPIKFALGIVLMALGFAALVVGAKALGEGQKVSIIWLALAYFFHTLGEISLYPVGLSAVTKLSVPKVVGFMMGVYFLAMAYSELMATQIAKIASIPTVDGSIQDVGSALTTYTNFFEQLMWIGLAVGVVLLAISPLLKKGMHGIK